jgi:hypothetical protein
VELVKNRETRIPVGILVDNLLPFYKFSKCLLPKNELLKNMPLLLNVPEMCALVICIRGQFSEVLPITTRQSISYIIKLPNNMLTLN